ncbi:MAG: 16S rRNA (cytidine(1402)-2'-O)-methyltransferase [Pseudomonadota bacterium]
MTDPNEVSPPMPVRLEHGLYIVATPIGAARDITLRALDTLAAVDLIAAEDTRMARKLMEIHGIALAGRSVVPYHDHNGAEMRPKLLAALGEGRSVAYVSDAGTPMVADPGFTLARAAIDAGHAVFSVPGASAALAALTVSGLPTDRFHFAGFAPQAAGKLRTFLVDLSQIDATLVVYEVPRRLKRFLETSVEVLGADRQVAICRELTKKFEDIQRGSLSDLADRADELVLKGECVVVMDRPGADIAPDDATIAAAVTALLDRLSFKDAVQAVAEDLKLPRRDVYQIGLTLPKPDDRKD